MLNNNKGQTLVELSLVIVLLLMLVVGFTEFSRAWHNTTVLTNAARAGARYASTLSIRTSFLTSVTNYTRFQAMTGLEVGSSEVLVNVSAFSSGFPSATSYTLSANSYPPLRQGARVTVIVRHNFEGLGGNIVPIISGPKSLARRASMSYQGN